MSDNFDFSEFSPEDEPEFEATMQNLVSKAEEAVSIKVLIDELEAELKGYQDRFNALSRKEIPAIAKELGVKSVDLTDGTKIKITEGVTASQLDSTKEHFEFAKSFLAENDASDLLKTVVSVQFGQGSHNESLALVADLKDRGYDTSSKETVHASTYKSFGNELYAEYQKKIENGEYCEEPPFKELGMFLLREAKIVPRRAK